jgi:hypothetical protein
MERPLLQSAPQTAPSVDFELERVEGGLQPKAVRARPFVL